MKNVYLILFAVFLIIGIIIIFSIMFFILNTPGSTTATNFTDINKTEIGIEQINLVLYDFKAYNLKTIPFSSNNPKIEIRIGNETYNAEIIKGKIITEKGAIDKEDIRMIISEQDFLNALNSNDLKAEIKDSFEKRDSKIELIAGNTELLVKGYLSIYKEISGKKLTGSMIRIFKI